MKKKIKSKVIKKAVPLTKSLGELMKDEDGFVSKETILKVGLSTVAALGMTGAFSSDVQGLGPAEEIFHNNTIALNPTHTCVNHTNVTTHHSY